MKMAFVNVQGRVPRNTAHNHTPAPISYNIRQESQPYQPPTPRVIERNFQSSRYATICEILDLQKRSEGWDGYSAPAPNRDAIANALHWAGEMSIAADSTRFMWSEPYVSSDEDGHVSFEWWVRERKITIYISPNAVEYVKSWGMNILTEMEDGEIESIGTWRALWSWLYL